MSDLETAARAALEALKSTTAALVAATSLAKRGGRKAAPSDTMFRMMIADYQKAADEGRASIAALEAALAAPVCPSCDGTGLDLWDQIKDENGILAPCQVCDGEGVAPRPTPAAIRRAALEQAIVAARTLDQDDGRLETALLIDVIRALADKEPTDDR